MVAQLETRRGNLEPSAHNPKVRGSSPLTATKSLNTKHIPESRRVKFNAVLKGETLAVLVCPASNKKHFAVTIDLSDLERVMAFGHWRVQNVSGKKGVCLYAVTGSGKNITYMHRFIVGAAKDRLVDHIHHRTLDNRKSELRETTRQVNCLNQRIGLQATSPNRPYRGVSLLPYGRYRACASAKHVGCYDTPEQARDAIRDYLKSQGITYMEAL